MTSPLFLKSFEITNQIFKCILRRNGFAYLSPETKRFETINSSPEIRYYYFFLINISLMMLCSVDVVYEMFVTQTLPVSLPVLSFNLAFIVILNSVIAFLVVFFWNRHVLFKQFVNSLLNYENTLLSKKAKGFLRSTKVSPLEKGMLKLSILNLITCQV